mmetsp:Transcript_27686/g.59129  ORF Transcript_27686/g.59129 Transcript_27686/m.59129 type:complete len:262 (+) Transcript_27686:378-1163(+)
MSIHETEPLEMSVDVDDDDDDDDDTNNVVFDALQVEYKDMASWYDRFWNSYTTGTLKIPLNEVLKEIKHTNATLSLVDVGCGTGAFLRHLMDICLRFKDSHGEDISFKLTGIEPSKEMLQQAQNKFDMEEGSFNVMLKRSPAENVPLSDDSANILVSTNAFHFFRDKDRSLQEMKRVLKQDGTLIITDWCNDYWIVKLYHFIERLRWNWRFTDSYPGPLTSSKLTELVGKAGFCEVKHTRYRVRVFSLFFWGMQTITAKKR